MEGQNNVNILTPLIASRWGTIGSASGLAQAVPANIPLMYWFPNVIGNVRYKSRKYDPLQIEGPSRDELLSVTIIK